MTMRTQRSQESLLRSADGRLLDADPARRCVGREAVHVDEPQRLACAPGDLVRVGEAAEFSEGHLVILRGECLAAVEPRPRNAALHVTERHECVRRQQGGGDLVTPRPAGISGRERHMMEIPVHGLGCLAVEIAGARVAEIHDVERSPPQTFRGLNALPFVDVAADRGVQFIGLFRALATPIEAATSRVEKVLDGVLSRDDLIVSQHVVDVEFGGFLGAEIVQRREGEAKDVSLLFLQHIGLLPPLPRRVGVISDDECIGPYVIDSCQAI
jgi:hypothetical protein